MGEKHLNSICLMKIAPIGFADEYMRAGKEREEARVSPGFHGKPNMWFGLPRGQVQEGRSERKYIRAHLNAPKMLKERHTLDSRAGIQRGV